MGLSLKMLNNSFTHLVTRLAELVTCKTCGKPPIRQDIITLPVTRESTTHSLTLDIQYINSLVYQGKISKIEIEYIDSPHTEAFVKSLLIKNGVAARYWS